MFPLLRTRETVILLCAALLVVQIFLTGIVTRAYHQKLAALAQQWLAAGEQELKLGHATGALADFRNALVYAPDDSQIQLRLALALAASGRDNEANAYLLGLLARAPADAPVNLALARISAAGGPEADAMRYYHSAIYGVWPRDGETNRLKTRLELCQFLIARHDTSGAEAELIAFAAEIPNEGGGTLDEQAGELFLTVGDANRALVEFRRALAAPHPPAGSLRGAGLAAFQLGDYFQAERYLDRASRIRKDDPMVSQSLTMSRLVLVWNPYATGLSATERADRARHDFEQAFSRLQSCARQNDVNVSVKPVPQSDLATLYAKAVSLRPQLTEQGFRRDPGLFDATMNLVFNIENLVAQQCGPPKGFDQVLVLIGKSPRNVQQ
ncbi:MAG: tetratricopeptide repeat protein [Candidatus Acidiferrales bacterium]